MGHIQQQRLWKTEEKFSLLLCLESRNSFLSLVFRYTFLSSSGTGHRYKRWYFGPVERWRCWPSLLNDRSKLFCLLFIFHSSSSSSFFYLSICVLTLPITRIRYHWSIDVPAGRFGQQSAIFHFIDSNSIWDWVLVAVANDVGSCAKGKTKRNQWWPKIFLANHLVWPLLSTVFFLFFFLLRLAPSSKVLNLSHLVSRFHHELVTISWPTRCAVGTSLVPTTPIQHPTFPMRRRRRRCLLAQCHVVQATAGSVWPVHCQTL